MGKTMWNLMSDSACFVMFYNIAQIVQYQYWRRIMWIPSIAIFYSWITYLKGFLSMCGACVCVWMGVQVPFVCGSYWLFLGTRLLPWIMSVILVLVLADIIITTTLYRQRHNWIQQCKKSVEVLYLSPSIWSHEYICVCA